MAQEVQQEERPLSDAVRDSLEISLRPPSIEQSPSPHFYGHDVFDAGVYDSIRAHLPESQFYGGVDGRTGNVRAKKSRLALPLIKENLDRFPDQIRPFWSDMNAYFRSDVFVKLAIAAYQPVLKDVRPDLLTHAKFEIRYELLRDTTAYGIGPHSDHPMKVMTLLFYLSSGQTTESLGTSFYVPKENGFKCQTGRHYPSEGFDRIKTYPYAPNTVLSFLRTDQSFHGVEVIEEENVQRDVMRWMLWKAK